MAPPRHFAGLNVARQFTMSTNATNSDISTPESTSNAPPDSTSAGPATSSSPPITPDSSSTTTEQSTPPPSPTPTSTSTSTEEPPTSTTSPETPTTSTSTSTPTLPTTTTTTTSTTAETTPTSSLPPIVSSSVITTTQLTTSENGSTAFVTITSTQLSTHTPTPTDAPTSTDSSGALITSNGSSSSSLAEPAKIAVAVVVPIAAVALLVIGGIFFWRKRKQRKDAEEERRKEVEDYSYNPNNDPTIPDIASTGGAGAYEMKEDGASGYRGWGSTTLAGSTGRKASTTMSGGAAGVAYSDATSPTRGNFSDTRSGDGLMGEGSHSPEGEILGAMGPSSNDDNRGNGNGNSNGNVHRGPSNASSTYSAAGRSDGSGENGASYGGPAYLDQYGGNNPYSDGAYGQAQPGDLGGQPVIRDNPARRNTRIENSSHYPQQSAGISQNF
ncbi:hypothetical protein AAE478_005536 [Parahypoxylon ruwenzoriense]